MPVPPSGSYEAKIAIVGEFPHEQDILRNAPFCGTPGLELSKILLEAGISRESCYLTMVHKDRAPHGRVEGLIALKKKDITPRHVLFQGKMVLPEVVAGVEAIRQELLAVRPNVVAAVGNLALFALTGQWGAMNWRSSVMESTLIPGLKVIPVLSPALLHTQWKLRSIMVHDWKRVAKEAKSTTLPSREHDILIRPTIEQALAAIDEIVILAGQHESNDSLLEVGSDIETRAGHISSIAFAWEPAPGLLKAITIPLMCVHGRAGYWSAPEEALLVTSMYHMMRKVKVIGQNWNYDAQYIHRHWHFICPVVEDTMIKHHSVFSNLEKNLAFLSSMYLDDHLYWKDALDGWEEEGEYWTYNATDAIRTLQISRVLDNVIKAMRLEKVYEFQQHLASKLVLKAMNRGVRFDTAARMELSLQLQQEAADRNVWMEEVIGRPINIKSPKQMQELFYEELGQKVIRVRNAEGGLSPTTNDEALHKIAEREPLLKPLTRKISELRSLGVFHSTFVQAALDADGRMRTSYNVAGTETYRFSSSKNAFGTGLNLQNVPKGGDTEDDGLTLPNVRKLFIPDPGHTMFDIDLDSADLRIVTWESDCAWMKDHFKNGRKPYVEVMREYYRNQSMTKSSHPREYAIFKSLCHGTNYLGTAEGIAPRIGLLVHETARIQKWYFGLAPEIKAWQERIKIQVTKRRYIENVFGYRMNIFDKIEGTIFNQAVAWIPQSTVACLINRAWDNIDRNLPEVEVLLQVHDSLVGQYENVHGDWALRRIVEEAQVPLPYPEPLVIPVGVVNSKKSWGDCE